MQQQRRTQTPVSRSSANATASREITTRELLSNKEGIPPDQFRLIFDGALPEKKRKVRIVAVHAIPPPTAAAMATVVTPVSVPTAQTVVPPTKKTKELRAVSVDADILEQMRAAERISRSRATATDVEDDDDDEKQTDRIAREDEDEAQFTREDDLAYIGEEAAEQLTGDDEEYADEIDWGGIVKGKKSQQSAKPRPVYTSLYEARLPRLLPSTSPSACGGGGVAATSVPVVDDGVDVKTPRRPTARDVLETQRQSDRKAVKRKREEASAAIAELAGAHHSWDPDSARYGESFEPTPSADSNKLDAACATLPLQRAGFLKDATDLDVTTLDAQGWTPVIRSGRVYNVYVEEEQVVTDRQHDFFDKINPTQCLAQTPIGRGVNQVPDSHVEMHGPLPTTGQHQKSIDRTLCKRTLLKTGEPSSRLYQIVYFSSFELQSDGIVIDGKFTSIPRPTT